MQLRAHLHFRGWHLLVTHAHASNAGAAWLGVTLPRLSAGHRAFSEFAIIPSIAQERDLRDAYFAGLFDGEGTVRVDRMRVESRARPYTRYQLKCTMQMTCPHTIREIFREYGGMCSRFDKYHLKNPGKHRIQYQWGVWSDIAYRFLKRIQPYAITKRDQIELGISYQEHVKQCLPIFRKHRGSPPNAEEIYAWRDSLYEQMAHYAHLPHDCSNDWLREPSQ
jgi:hypothetical protein